MMEIESIIILGGFLMLPVIAVFYMLMARKKSEDFKDFNPVPFKHITKKGMQDKLNLYGKKVKNGTLLIGFEHIRYINKFYQTKGEFPVIEYDVKENIYKNKVDPKTKKDMVAGYDILMFRAGNKNLMFRLLGFGYSYFIIKNQRDKIDYYPFNCTWKLPNGIDLMQYGDIWVDDVICGEYLNNMGIMDMNAQLMTHVLNYPNKVVHLETEQAKRERTNAKVVELEKLKYDDVKKAGDTTVG